MTDNKEAIDALKRGDENILRLLFDKYSGILLAFAKYSIRDQEMAEDIIQDVYFALWENRSDLNSELSIKSYLYKLTHHHCIHFCENKRLNQIMLLKLKKESGN